MGQAGLKRLLMVVVTLVGLLALDAPAFARHRMSFVPGHHGYTMHRRYGYHRSYRRHRGYAGHHRRGRPATARSAEPTDDRAPTRVPPGFKMEDGVLTYPAPARFQPQNLKRH